MRTAQRAAARWLRVLTKSRYSARKREPPAGETTSSVLSGAVRWPLAEPAIPVASSASSARTALNSSSRPVACETAHRNAGSFPSSRPWLRTGAAKGQRPWRARAWAPSAGARALPAVHYACVCV